MTTATEHSTAISRWWKTGMTPGARSLVHRFLPPSGIAGCGVDSGRAELIPEVDPLGITEPPRRCKKCPWDNDEATPEDNGGAPGLSPEAVALSGELAAVIAEGERSEAELAQAPAVAKPPPESRPDIRTVLQGLQREAEEASTVTVVRNRYGYTIDDQFFRRVTTFCQGIPKPWLGTWAAKEVAEFAYGNREAWASLPATDAVKLLKGAPWSKRDDAADRGSAVHAVLEAIVRNTPLPDTLHTEDELDCAIAAETFLKRFVGRFLASELTVYSPKHGYAGTLDLWCLDTDGLPWIIDFKSGRSVYAEHAVQQAAYHNAEYAVVRKQPCGMGSEEKWTGRVISWGPNRALRLGVLHVRPDGATLHPIRYSERLWTVFRAAAHTKLWQLDVDDYGGKTPRERVYGPPLEVSTKEAS